MDHDQILRIDETMAALERRLDELDLDAFDLEAGDGKLVIVFDDDGSQLILSRQSANGQIWLAEPGGGWHFDWDGERWMCDKRGLELVQTLEDLIAGKIGEMVDLR